MDYRQYNPTRDKPSDLYQKLKTLPKIELHRHLEGSLRLATMAEIAQEHQLNLPGYEVDDFRHLVQMTESDLPTADTFIAKFETLRHFYRSPEIIDRVAYEAVADAAAENIVYMELRFTPIALAREMGFDLADVAQWVIAAVQRAEAEHEIEVRLLVSMNRHESVELGEQHLDVAIANMAHGVVGVDLAGSENHFSAVPFMPVFKRAREAGLNITIHAGEWAGPENVVQAINEIGAKRIGHGVRSIEDSNVVQLAREQNIAFEVCLTSNVQTGVTPSLSQHPLRDLYQMGVQTTINTDDPSISGINLTDEYVIARKHLDFTLEDLKQHIIHAAQSTFLSPIERDQLVKRLRLALGLSEPKSTS